MLLCFSAMALCPRVVAPIVVLLLLSVADLASSEMSPSPMPSPASGSPIRSRPALPPVTSSSPTPIASPPHKTPLSPRPEAPSQTPIPPTARIPAPAPSDAVSDAFARERAMGDLGGGSDMRGRKKAAIAVGLILAAGLLAAAAAVYKKRRDNVRRSRYSHATCREIL